MNDNGQLEYCAEDVFAHVVNPQKTVTLSKVFENINERNREKIENTGYQIKTHNLKKSDRLYLQTDGFFKQINKQNNEMFGYERTEKLITELGKYDLKENKDIVEKKYLEWKQNTEQIDDYLILGIRC